MCVFSGYSCSVYASAASSVGIGVRVCVSVCLCVYICTHTYMNTSIAPSVSSGGEEDTAKKKTCLGYNLTFENFC
jgi:hypothetical protein